MRWEYKVELLVSLDPVSLKVRLNELGGEGWELVVIVGGFYYFKRPAGIACQGCCE